jgi:hypothetical protein
MSNDFIPDSQFVPDQAPPAQGGPAPGFVPDSQFQPDEEKFGTPGQELLTAGEGVAKGLAGPIATGAEALLSKAGVPGLSPEEQAGRAAANPWIHGGAEAAGFIAPAVATLGGSAEARAGIEAASKFTQAGVLSQIGEGAAKLSGLGGEGASTISRIAASGIKTGAEMAALQAGDEASKLINQDPNQSLGTAAINIGLSGVIGGAGGTVLGAVSPLWKTSMEKIGVPKLIDDAKAQYNFRQSLPNGGDTAATIVDEANTRMNEVDNIRSQMGDLKAKALAPSMPEVTPENTAKIDAQIQDISDKMSQNIEKASDNAYLKGAVPKLTQDFQDFLQVATDPNATYADKFDAIDNLKRAQQAKGNYNLTAEDTALGQFTKGFARELRLSLEDPKVWGDAANVQSKVNSAIKNSIDAEKDAVGKFTSKSNVEGGSVADPTKVNTLVNQSLKGKAGLKTNVMQNYLEATQDLADTINKIHTDAGLEAPVRLTPTPALDHTLGRSSAGTTLGNWMFDKGLASVAGHIGGDTAGAGLGSLVGHPMLGAIAGERLLSPALTSIAKPLLENATRSDAMKSALDYSVSVLRGDKILNQAAENLFKSGAEIVPKQLLPNVASREKAEKSLEYASNPDNSSNIGGSLGHYLPDHATAAGAAAANASNYFNQLKPRAPQQGPLDKPAPIDKAKQASYNRQLDIAQQPLLIMKHAKEGTLLPQDIQTVNTIYPGLLKKISTQTYSEMVKATAEGKHIPYSQRLGLSQLIGHPLDNTMTPMAMQSIMATSNSRSEQTQPQGKQKKASGVELKQINKVNNLYATKDQSRQLGHGD